MSTTQVVEKVVIQEVEVLKEVEVEKEASLRPISPDLARSHLSSPDPDLKVSSSELA